MLRKPWSKVFSSANRPLLLHLAAEPRASVAVDRRPVRAIAGKREADAQNASGRIARGQDVAGQRIHLQRAGDRLGEHRGVAAQRAAGIDRVFEAAAGGFLDLRAPPRRCARPSGGVSGRTVPYFQENSAALAGQWRMVAAPMPAAPAHAFRRDSFFGCMVVFPVCSRPLGCLIYRKSVPFRQASVNARPIRIPALFALPLTRFRSISH